MENFKKIVSELKNELFRYARKVTGNYEDAEDIVQEAFLKLWRDWDKVDIQRIRFLAFRVTRNLCIDKMRSKHYKTKTTGYDSVSSELTDYGKTPHEIAEVRNAGEIISKIIDSFPESWRSIFHLCDIEELPYVEVAAILGMNEPALRVNLSRIRKRIREQMVKNYGYCYEK